MTDDTLHVNGIKQQLKADGADLSGSSFTDVNLSGANFNNVNFAGAQFEDANLSGWSVRNANLTHLNVYNADLRGASFSSCLTHGLTIDGIDVSDLLTAYRVLITKAD